MFMVDPIKKSEFFNVDPPIFMELKPFAYTLYAYGAKSVDHSKDFLISPYVHQNFIWDSKNREVIGVSDVSRTLYTTMKCPKEYIVIKRNKDALLTNDPPDVEDFCGIKIINRPDYTLGNLDMRILERIEEMEILRNKSC